MRRILTQVAAFQLGWWSCVLGAGRGLPWLGPAVVAVLAVSHIATVKRRAPRREALVLGLTLAVGAVADSAQMAAGAIGFASNPLSPLPPPFMLALWANFGMHLTGLMRPFSRRPLAGAVFGVLGGPLAYWGGHALGALALGENRALALGTVALTWAAVMPLLARASAGIAAPTRTASPISARR